MMEQTQLIVESPTKLILDLLGLEPNQLEPAAEQTGAYRIQFEKQFAVEIQDRASNTCRLSNRVCRLSHNQETQAQQLSKALIIFSMVSNECPPGFALAISKHDNCLRSILEIKPQNDSEQNLREAFDQFVEFAYAYRETFITHRND